MIYRTKFRKSFDKFLRGEKLRVAFKFSSEK